MGLRARVRVQGQASRWRTEGRLATVDETQRAPHQRPAATPPALGCASIFPVATYPPAGLTKPEAAEVEQCGGLRIHRGPERTWAPLGPLAVHRSGGARMRLEGAHLWVGLGLG